MMRAFKSRRYSMEDYRRVETLYASGTSSPDIDKQLGWRDGVSRDYLRRMGLMRSRSAAKVLGWKQGKHKNPYSDGLKYRYVLDFFTCGTPEMAWVLGLIYADGHVGRTQLEFAVDQDTAEKVQALLGGGTISQKRQFVVLRVSSIEICDSLRGRFGLESDKSRTMEFPILPMDLMPHFVRGYWDGDGHLSISGQKDRKIPCFKAAAVTASEKFASSLIRFLRTSEVVEAGALGGYTHRNRFSTGVRWQVKFGKKDTLNLCAWMYKGTSDGIRGKLNHEKWSWYAKTYPWADARKRSDEERKSLIPIHFIRG